MTTNETKINILYNFIINNMNEYDLERNDGDFYEFTDYEKFCKFQKNHLGTLDENYIMKLFNLMDLMINHDIQVMDKESMVTMNASGFCFNSDGKLVIFNER